MKLTYKQKADLAQFLTDIKKGKEALEKNPCYTKEEYVSFISVGWDFFKIGDLLKIIAKEFDPK